MTRYELTINSKQVALGWDAGLGASLTQVARGSGTEYDANELLMWAGTCSGEIPNVQQLGSVIGKHVPEIPPEVLAALERDKREELAGSMGLDVLAAKKPP